MGKVRRNISLDKDLNYELQERPYINVSAFCNKRLREHLEEEKQR